MKKLKVLWYISNSIVWYFIYAWLFILNIDRFYDRVLNKESFFYYTKCYRTNELHKIWIHSKCRKNSMEKLKILLVE